MIPSEYLVYYERAERIAAAFRRAGTRAERLAAQQEGFYGGSWSSPAEALSLWRRVKDLRHATYMDEARGAEAEPTVDPRSAEEGPGEAGYAAVASWFVLALAGGEPRTLILDLPNRGRMRDVPEDAVIEAPVRIEAGRAVGLPVAPLPEPQRELVGRVKEAERLTIRAAREGSAALALDALSAHPLVPSRDVAARILDGYLERSDELRRVLR
jgi:6-phospho-beta-glucosidase